MAISSKDSHRAPSRAAQAAMELKSKEAIAAMTRVTADMSVRDVLAVLTDNNVQVWHMDVNGAKVVFFAGEHATSQVAKAYAAIYGAI